MATGAVGDSRLAARCSFASPTRATRIVWRTSCPANAARVELSIYLRVWAVLYPEAEVQLVNDDDNEAPAA